MDQCRCYRSPVSMIVIFVICADEFPSVVQHRDLRAYPNTAGYKYALLKPPRLSASQLRLVGYTDGEIRAKKYENMEGVGLQAPSSNKTPSKL